MTIDKSLRVRRGATRNRSVLTRVERIGRLQEAAKRREPLLDNRRSDYKAADCALPYATKVR